MIVVGTVEIIPTKPVVPYRMQVAAYTRVSTGAERQLHSLNEQVSYYSRLIQSTPGWVYAGVFTDEGITGTSTKSRQGLADLMEVARGGGIDIVLCKSISRLARNTVDLLATVRELKNLGVAVRFEREGIDTLSSDGELLLTLLASFAQEESRSLSQNVKWSIQRRFTQGIPNSTLIYGYRWVEGQFVIEPREAKAIQLAYQWFIEEGVSAETITKRLNNAGYRSRFGKRIEPNLIRRALRNERYTGKMVLQKYYSTHIRQNNPPIKIPGNCHATWLKTLIHPSLPKMCSMLLKPRLDADKKEDRQQSPLLTPGVLLPASPARGVVNTINVKAVSKRETKSGFGGVGALVKDKAIPATPLTYAKLC